MFGNAEWFDPATEGRAMRPRSWRGWAYVLVWIGVIAAPFVALVWRHQPAESLIWLTSSLTLFAWDVRSIRRTGPTVDEQKVLFIGDDGQGRWYAAERTS